MRSVLFILFMLFCDITIAQTIPTFNLKRLDASTGLQHDERNVFTGHDEQGFNWIGSSDGPYRYDGQHLKHFKFSTDQKRSQVISDFFNLNDKDVWFSYPSGLGHYSYATNTLNTHEIKANKAAPLGLQLFAVDSVRNLLWLANGGEILSVHANDPSEIQSRSASKSVRHLAIATTDQKTSILGFPWLLSTGLERITISKENEIKVERSTDPTIQTLTLTGGAIDGVGRVWLCSVEGLHLYDPAQDRLLNSYTLTNRNKTKILDIEVYGDHILVASPEEGVWWFDPSQGRFWRKLKSAPHETLQLTDKPIALSKNSAGVIFVSRLTGGIDILVPQQAVCEKVLDTVSSHFAGEKLILDQDGRVYTCTPSGELIILNPDGSILSKLRPSDISQANDQTSIAQTTTGQIYYAHGVHIFKLETTGKMALRQVTRAASPIIALIGLEDKILVHTKEGVWQVSGQKLVSSGLSITPTPRAYIYNIGHERVLLNNLDGWWRILGFTKNETGAVLETRLTTIDSFPADGEMTNCSYASTRDTLLVGKIDGLARHARTSDGQWTSLGNDLSGSRVFDIEYKTGKPTWLLTDQGLAFGRAGNWRQIKKEHGLPDARGLMNALVVCGDSVVWAGFREGLVRYQHDTLKTNLNTSGKTYLKQICINEEELLLDDQTLSDGLSYSGRSQQLRIKLGTANVFDLQQPEFRYRVLGGGNEQWQSLGNSSILYAEPLAPGRYIVEAEAIDAAGRPIESVQLKIVSTQPYWETWWFRISALGTIGLLVAGFSYTVYRRRLLQERRKYEQELLLSQERERIARELHDDLGTDLSAILYLSDTEGQPINAKDQAEVVSLSQAALIRMREIVHTLDGGNISFTQFWKQIIQDTRASCLRYKVNFIVESQLEGILDKRSINQLTRRNLDLLIKESVSNALRHGMPTNFSLSLKPASSGFAQLTIRDDGTGFDASTVTSGMGLTNLRERANSLGAKIEISSQLGLGTTIEVLIPIAAI